METGGFFWQVSLSLAKEGRVMEWRKELLVVIFSVFGGAGCMGGVECEVQDTEGSGSRIECPGGEAIKTKEDVEGPCWKQGSQVECESGESFSTGGKEEGADGGFRRDGFGGYGRDGGFELDVQGPEGGWGNGESPSAGGGVSRAEPWSVGCQKTGRTVVCGDGRRARVPSGTEGPCRSKTILGKGRRIVCEDGTEVRPENRNKGKVSCEYRSEGEQRLLECSDGIVVTDDAIPGSDCEPTVEWKNKGEVVVKCGEKRSTISWREECEGTFELKTKEDLAKFAERECSMVVGDVSIGAPECEVEGSTISCPNSEPVEMEGEVVPPCWRTSFQVFCSDRSWVASKNDANFEVVETVGTLGGVEYVTGSVRVTGNPHLDQLELGALERVGHDLVVSQNPKMWELRGLGNLKVVGGGFELSENLVLRAWRPSMTLQRVKRGMVVTANEELELIGEFPAGAFVQNQKVPKKEKNWRFSKDVNVGGAGVVTHNDALGWCKSIQFGGYLGSRGATQVYVAGVNASAGTCKKVNWKE